MLLLAKELWEPEEKPVAELPAAQGAVAAGSVSGSAADRVDRIGCLPGHSKLESDPRQTAVH